MSRPTVAQRRGLGVWTAAWLALSLLVGLLWVGDIGLQWPVLLVPLVWLAVALRPRAARRATEPPRLD